MKKENEFKGYWYLYIHSKLKERSINNTISICEAKNFLFEWRLPKWLRVVVIKELENLELIEIENRHTIKFNDSKVDLDDISYIFNNVGLLQFD
jgi:hypothetical protein